MSSLYEQIKADLGYLKLDAAADVFATLADQARPRTGPTSSSSHDWSPSKPPRIGTAASQPGCVTRGSRYRRTIDDFDYEFQPSVDRKLVEDLATLRFIDENRPILFLGQPGCGKTHLAVALATLAVEAGYRGYFTTADNLCRTLVRASIEGNLASKMKSFTAPTVLVIDDVGLLPIGGTEASAVFFQVVNTRYEKGHPTIVTTNRGLPDWGTIFGDTVVAAAVLDRLMHNAIVFNIKGPVLAATRTQRPRDRHHQPRRRKRQLTSPTTGQNTDPMSVFDDPR